MTSTADDVIKAAASIARDAAEGRLSAVALEHQAVTDCRELFGTVAGPDDSLWPLHVDIARQVLALDGVTADELAEWLAVARQRAGEPLSEPDADAPSEPLPSAALSPDAAEPDVNAGTLADADAELEPGPVTVVTPNRRAERYDPFAGWKAARQGFLS